MTLDVSSPKPPSGRIYFIDAARAFLMFLGIPYHTCLAYSYFSSWTVKSDEFSYVASCIGAFIHSFRMPAFFVIAGYFSLMLIRKKGPAPWFRYRAPRLVVPLLFVGLAINPFIMLARSVGRSNTPDVYNDWIGQLTSIGPQWVAQLWFLGDLLFFSAALALICSMRRSTLYDRLRSSLACYPLNSFWLNAASLFAMGAFVVCAAIAVKLAGLSQFANGFIYPSRTFAQLPLFAFGVFISITPKHLSDFSQFRWKTTVFAVIACVIFAALTDRTDTPSILATFFITPAAGVLSAQVIFAIACRYLNRPNRLVQLGVDSSMTVYLIHMIFVVWLVLAFRLVHAPAVLEVVLISVIATGLSLLVSLVARRIPAFFFLLHGYALRNVPRRPLPLASKM